MTLAIFGIGTAMIYLFLTGRSLSQSSVATQRFDIGTAVVEYSVPEGCQDQVSIEDGAIEVRFSGETCAGRQILEASGNVSLIAE